MNDIDINIIVKDYENFHIVICTPELIWRENCYLLILPNKDCFIIDPGFACETICSYIEAHGYLAKGILLTHAHHDHLASAEFISRHFNIPCILNEADKRILMHAPMYSLRFAQQLIKRPENIVWLSDSFENTLAEEYGIHVFHTPGHTPGGVCFRYRDILFSGDTIVKEYVGRTDLPGSNRAQLDESVNRLLKNHTLSDDMVMYPGHGMAWTMKEARIWWRKGHCQEQKDFG